MPEFILAYSLGQVNGVPTSDEARKAFRTELAKKWSSTHLDPNGVLRKLPETTVIGTFPTPEAAKTSIAAARSVGRGTVPGPFALTRQVLSTFTLEALAGGAVTPPAPKPAADKATTRASKFLKRLSLKQE